MSKQAKMYQDLLSLSDKMFDQVIAMYEDNRQLLNQDEIAVIEAMLEVCND